MSPALTLSPGTLTPRLVIGLGPSKAQASRQAILFEGLSVWRIVPSAASRASAATPSLLAVDSRSAFNASVAALRQETEIPPIVVLPPEGPDCGYSFLPIRTLTASSGRPRVSATTIPTHVRVPTPRSCVPIFASTEPSGLIVTSHSEGCPCPPH